MIKTIRSLIGVLTLSLFFTVRIQAQTVTPAPANTSAPRCSVTQYETHLNQIEPGIIQYLPIGSVLRTDRNYVYSVTVHSSSPSVRETITRIEMQHQAGAQEPLEILQVKSIAGPCTVSSDKRVACTMSYSYADEANQPIEILVHPYYKETAPYTSTIFSVWTDQGMTTCTSANQIYTVATPTPIASRLPSVQEFSVVGYRSLPDSPYKEAILSWKPVRGAMHYELFTIGSTEASFGLAKDPTYTLRFLPSSIWYIAIRPVDSSWMRGERSIVLAVEYPGRDSWPEVPLVTPSPIPSSSPLPTPVPMQFDSTKIAVLEEKIDRLEDQVVAQGEQNTQQSAQISMLESIVRSMRSLLSKIFRWRE